MLDAGGAKRRWWFVSHHPTTVLVIAWSFAAIVRGGMLIFGADFETDPDAYRIIAETLAIHGGYGLPTEAGSWRPTAFRPPLYPWMLSWGVRGGSLIGVAGGVLHFVLGMATVTLAGSVASRLHRTADGRVAKTWLVALVMLLVACDPLLLWQSRLLMTETLATFLATILWWAWVLGYPVQTPVSEPNGPERWLPCPRWAAGCGFAFAAAFLCRPTFLIQLAGLALAVATASVWRMRFDRRTMGLRGMAIVLVGLVAPMGFAIAAWSLRNARVMGAPVWATTHGGYTLLLANNESFYDHIGESPLSIGPLDRRWDAEPFLEGYMHRYNADARKASFWDRDWRGVELRAGSTTEVGDDRYVSEIAKATITRRPGLFLWSCVVRFCRLWNPLPHESGAAGIAVGVGYTLIFAAAIWGGWRIRFWRDPRWWPAVALGIALSAVHAVYWSNPRMRSPVSVPVAILAASGVFAFRKSRIGLETERSSDLHPNDLSLPASEP